MSTLTDLLQKTNINGSTTQVTESPHPFDTIRVDEINETVRIIKANRPTDRLWIKFVQVREPLKQTLLPYLAAERDGRPLPPRPARETECLFFNLNNRDLYKVVVDLDSKQEIESLEVRDHHAPLDRDELNHARDTMLKHPKVLAALAELEIPANTTITPQLWPVGAQDEEPAIRHVFYTFYHRNPRNNHPSSNIWGNPLPLAVFWDIWEEDVMKIQWLPTGDEHDGLNTETAPKKYPAQGHIDSEYLPELRSDKPRTDLKPLHVNQPDGPSFSVNGGLIEWQKWRFRISFNYREGPVIHDVSYDKRRLFYRLSLSEMHVPYADPRPPYHLKQVFDFGDIGLGRSANSLENGCDCLGLMKYFDGAEVGSDGVGRPMKNVICLHEQDNGILWKKTYTPTGRAAVVRNRILTVQTIITVGNYDYIFAWQFDQAGALHLETRATGILSTAPIDVGKTSPYGTVVAPGVFGPSHQHFVNVRIDPSIDGDQNSIVYEDVVSVERGPKDEHGVGFVAKKTPITKAGWADASPLTGRVFKILNPNKINPYSQTPVGYKFSPHPSQMRLAYKDGIIAKRAPFTQHHIWVSTYKDRELYAAGDYTNQSNGNAKGLEAFVQRQDNVENTDVVLWTTFALTHIPRVEDFPVMPVETHMISFKPCNFFTENPAVDVPLSNQDFNQSHTVNGCCSSEGDLVSHDNGM